MRHAFLFRATRVELKKCIKGKKAIGAKVIFALIAVFLKSGIIARYLEIYYYYYYFVFFLNLSPSTSKKKAYKKQK